jgi:plastocyanin
MPSGVIHGQPDGNRLRPEDSSSTEAQFLGQQDMYARRKLIDDLVGTGVPAVAAHEAGERRSPALALLYLLIPILAIAFLLAQDDSAPAEAAPPEEGDSGAVVLVVQNVAFDTDEISLTADEESEVTLNNEDAAAHNFSIYEDDSAEADLFTGAEVGPGASTSYSVPALEKGEYFFRCDLHPSSMTGTVVVR